MTTQHTPGPWEIKHDFDNDTSVEVKGRHTIYAPNHKHLGVNIARVWEPVASYYPDGVQQANARLIAAAPDLLATLKAVRKAYTETDTVRALDLLGALTPQIDAAIAKSEGIPGGPGPGLEGIRGGHGHGLLEDLPGGEARATDRKTR